MREFIQNNRRINKTRLPDPRLVNYVSQCRKMKISDEEIRIRLLKIGWPESEVNSVLGKTEIKTAVPFFVADAKSDVSEGVDAHIVSLNNKKDEIVVNKKKSKFFSKKIFFVVIAGFFLVAIAFLGYYSVKPNSQKSPASNSSKKTSEADCVFDKLPKPENQGSAVFRVDSTMKLLVEAITQGNYCLTLSLFTEDSRDKYKDLLKSILADENKRGNFLGDLKNYMIPAIDENNPSSEAKATITRKSIKGSSGTFYIKFSKKESGEYMISGM